MNRLDQRPVLTTEHLILRTHTLADAPDVQRLIGVWEVCSTLLRVPYPYPDGAAEQFIGKYPEKAEKGEYQFAITDRRNGQLIGGIGFHNFEKEFECAEIGYWIGKPYWGQGYCTEAAGAVLKFGFEVLGLNRIHANHFKHNPASGRVMQKIGMKHEGCQRQHIKKWGEYVDLELYGILKSEYLDGSK